MPARSGGSKAQKGHAAREIKNRVSKPTRHNMIKVDESEVSNASQSSDIVAVKPRNESKRSAEAHDGVLISMVKVGWGLAKMLDEYNKKQVERGLPKLEQIDDPYILELVEIRRKVQQRNTRAYQARMTKRAVLGDLEAARKLKWSAPRMKALKLWVLNGKIGRFEEKIKVKKAKAKKVKVKQVKVKQEQEESDDSDLDDLEEDFKSESESEPDYASEIEPESEPDVEMEDNIQVAGPPVDAWTRELALMKETPATPSLQIKEAIIPVQPHFFGDDLWDYPMEMASNSPESVSNNKDIDHKTAPPTDGGNNFGLVPPGNQTGDSWIGWDQILAKSRGHCAETKYFINDDLGFFSADDFTGGGYTTNAFQYHANHDALPDPFASTGPDTQRQALQQEVSQTQRAANAAEQELKVAQDARDQANKDLFDVWERKAALDLQIYRAANPTQYDPSNPTQYDIWR